MAHANEKGSYDLIPNTAYFDFDDLEWSNDFHRYQEIVCMVLMIIGIALKIMGVNVPKKAIIHMVFWINIIMSIPKVFERTNRYGIDYIAYI